MSASVSSVLKRYGMQYLDRFGHTMTAQQKKVLRAVMACRTESLGTIRYRCVSCGGTQTVPRSCCNRHCPACQHERVQAWLAEQTERLLPCHYFLITFTVPQEVRAAMLAHPAEGYAALLTAAAESLKTAATNERHVGAREVGMFGVLAFVGKRLDVSSPCSLRRGRWRHRPRRTVVQLECELLRSGEGAVDLVSQQAARSVARHEVFRGDSGECLEA